MSLRFQRSLRNGSIGPAKVMMMPLTMKPPQRIRKMRFWAELRVAGTVCVSESIMAFCRRQSLEAMRHARSQVMRGVKWHEMLFFVRTCGVQFRDSRSRFE